jgi:hypothetical protein
MCHAHTHDTSSAAPAVAWDNASCGLPSWCVAVAGGLVRQSFGNIASVTGLHLAYPTVAVQADGGATIAYAYSADITIPDFNTPTTNNPTYPGETPATVHLKHACSMYVVVVVVYSVDTSVNMRDHTHCRYSLRKSCCSHQHIAMLHTSSTSTHILVSEAHTANVCIDSRGVSQALHLNQPLMTASAAPVLCGWVATPGAACWALQVGQGTLSKSWCPPREARHAGGTSGCLANTHDDHPMTKSILL